MDERRAILQEARKLIGARDSLLEFARLLVPGYMVNPALLETIEAFEAIERGELNRLIVIMPPRHGKSMLLSQLAPAWYLGRNPTRQVVNAGYGIDIALEHSRKARGFFTSEEFRRVFPGVGQGQQTSAGQWDTNQNGRYYAVGIDGGLTGRGMHLGIIDDPVKNRREADSLLIRDHDWGWYISTFYPRRAPINAIIVIMTHWHEDDLAGRLIKQMESGLGDKWRVIHYPMLSGKNEDIPLWPEQFPLEYCLATKKAMTATGNTRDWESLQQGRPSAGSSANALWTQDCIDKNRVHERPTMPQVAVAIDPSTTNKSTSDEAGIIAGGIGEDGHLYIIEDRSLRASPQGWAAEAIGSFKRNQADRLIYESNQGGDMVALTLATVDPMVPTFGVHASRGKRTRAEPVAALYSQGFVHHVGPFPELESQMTSWIPGEPSPDRMDALVWLISYLIEHMAHQEQTFVMDTVEEFGGIDTTGVMQV